MNKNKIKYYKHLDRGQWAELKLKEVLPALPNKVISDIGAGFGWFGPVVKKLNLTWQPFDYVKKIEETKTWDLNTPAPKDVKPAGGIIFLEVLEHLSNPGLGLKNLSVHLENGGYIFLSCPNPFFARSKITMLTKNQLYAFQPKHIEEHHVFVPLPHVVEFFLNNYNFEIVEQAIIGNLYKPKFELHFNYIKSLIKYFLECVLVLINPQAQGHTQGFVAIKRE